MRWRWWHVRTQTRGASAPLSDDLARALAMRRRVDQAEVRAENDKQRLSDVSDQVTEAFRKAMRGRAT